MNAPTIIAWNNHAVTLVENGQFRRGMNILRAANRLLAQDMQEEHSRTGSSSDRVSSLDKKIVSYDCTSHEQSRVELCESKKCSATDPTAWMRQRETRPRKQALEAHECLCQPDGRILEDSDSQEEKPFIYQRLIRIHRIPVERGNYILSFIVLFNIALTYQLQVLFADNQHLQHPLNTHQRRLHLCHGSLDAYRCAFSMKNNGRIRLDSTILLALTNNMCHLSAALRMSAQAEHLRELLTTALVMATGDEFKSIIEVDGFWKTALTNTNGCWNVVPRTAGAA